MRGVLNGYGHTFFLSFLDIFFRCEKKCKTLVKRKKNKIPESSIIAKVAIRQGPVTPDACVVCVC